MAVAEFQFQFWDLTDLEFFASQCDVPSVEVAKVRLLNARLS